MNLKAKTKWKCQVCLKYLSSKRSYDEHMNIHEDSRPFACDQCVYAAASQMTLRRHKLRNHVSRQSWGYQCPYCSEIYMEPASYQQHVSTRHLGRSATFGCRQVGCTFITKSSKHLCEHIKKHRMAISEHFIYNKNVPTSEKSLSLRQENINLAAYLVDDDNGSGSGKEIIRQVITHNVKDVLAMTKRKSALNNCLLRNAGIMPQTGEFIISNKDFLKSPINLNFASSREHKNAQNSSQKNSINLIKTSIPSISNSNSNHLSFGENVDYYIKDINNICKIDEMNNAKVDWIESEIVIEEVVEHSLLDEKHLLEDLD